MKGRFLLFAWMDPPILFAGNTFLSDLLVRFGAENAVPRHWRQPFPQVSEEWLAIQKIDRVYFLDDGWMAGKKMQLVAAKWWGKYPPEVISLPADLFARATFTPLHSTKYLRTSAVLNCE